MKFFNTMIDFLGYNIQYGSYQVIQISLDFIDNFPNKILDKTQLQRFLGSLNYVSKFLQHCTQERKLLNQRLQKIPIPWDIKCTIVVRNIKERIRRIQPLCPIQEKWKKVIMIDSINIGWGDILCQENPEKKDSLEISQSASRLWSTSQTN